MMLIGYGNLFSKGKRFSFAHLDVFPSLFGAVEDSLVDDVLLFCFLGLL